MDLKKTIITIVSVLVVAVTGILLFIYWPAITGTINNSQYLTPEQGQALYDKGYDDGYKDKTENTAQLDYYRSLVDGYYTTIQDYERQIASLQESTSQKTTIIGTLEGEKVELENRILELSQTNSSNQETINSLEVMIDTLQEQVRVLTLSGNSKTNEIAQLNNQISGLQTVITQLQNTNNLNANTITSLNAQIVNLNTRISELSYQVQNNTTSSNALTDRITELEHSISYYEQFIATLENSEQVVVTFEFDGSVYNIQIIDKNTTTTVNNPTSTNRVIFNGWKVNNQTINLSTYTFSQNTTVIADVTYKKQVDFKVDDVVVNTQYVVVNNHATLPTNPTKAGYDFDGWTTNGVDVVNVSNMAITNDTIFIAKFTQLYTVTFTYESNTVSTQSVRNGEYATAVNVSNTSYKAFNGWTINGAIVDLTTYRITANTTFVASITYSYDVNFVVENTTYSTIIVQNGNYATMPTDPTKTDYDFMGWSLDGTTVVDLSHTPITQTTTYYAVFQESVKIYNVQFVNKNALMNVLQYEGGSTIGTLNKSNLHLYENSNGYGYMGISTDGTYAGIISDSELASYVVTQDTTFYIMEAKYPATTPQAVTYSGVTSCVYSYSDSIIKTNNCAISFNLYIEYTESDYGGHAKVDECKLNGTVFRAGSYSYYFTKDFTTTGSMTSYMTVGFVCDATYSITNGNITININRLYRSSTNYHIKSVKLQNLMVHDYTTQLSANYTEIGRECFKGRTDLVEYVVPSNITKIGAYAFQGCTNLERVVLPVGIIKIDTNTFSGCTNLTSVNIPSTVTYIGSQAFYNCASLTKIIIPSAVETIYGQYVFDKCTSLTIYVEATSVPSTWTSGWNKLNRPVYCYSETYRSGYWHYGQDGETPVLW